MAKFKSWIEYQRTNKYHHNDNEDVKTEIKQVNHEHIEDIMNI
jgi:hypothetical protein